MTRMRRLGSKDKRDARKRHKRSRSRTRAYKDPDERSRGASEALADLDHILADADGPIRSEDFEPRCRKERSMRLESTEARVEQELGPILEIYDKTAELYRQFREKWQIKRDPDEQYLPEAQTRAHWIIAIACSLEVAFSAYAFGRHLANILAGFIPAMLPAAIVLFLAFLTIRAARWIVVSRWPHRVVGALLASVSSGSATVALLAAAHYRDDFEASAAENAVPVAAAESFIEHMLGGPANLSSMSWWLFLFSIAAFVFTCFHFWHSDDPHPGYGKKARVLDAASEEVATVVGSIQNEIKTIMDATLEGADHTVLERRTQLKEAVLLIKDEWFRQDVFDPDVYELSGDEPPRLVELLKRYRQVSAWLESNRALGDMKVRLSRPVGEEDVEDSGPREVDSLVQAVTAEEGWLWLDQAVEKFGFRRETETGEAAHAAT